MVFLIACLIFFAQGVSLYAQQTTTGLSVKSTKTNRHPQTLIESIRQDLPMLAEEFIQQRVGITVKDKQGRTALIWAAFKGQSGIVKQLAEKGVDINAKDYEGMNALMYAAMEGKTTLLEWLCQHGAKVNAQDNLGRTPLMYAALYGQPSIIPILLGYGADTQIKNHKGMTALQLVQFKSNPQVEMLLRQLPMKRSRQSTPKIKRTLQVQLPVSPKMRSFKKKRIAANTPSPSLPSKPVSTDPLPVLPMKVHASMVSIEDGYSLKQAAIEGNSRQVLQLISRGVAVDYRDTDGMTALMWASRYGHTATAKLLIDQGADVYLKEYIFNWNPLMWAGRYGHTSTVKLLVAAGSDARATDKHGWTVLDLALSNYKKDIVKFLESR